MPGAKDLVTAKIQGKKVMVFSKTYCPFCVKAKKEFQKLLDSGKLDQSDYEVMELDSHKDADEIQKYLRSITGASSVPRVFIKGNCIGGGDETVALARSGKLAEKIA